MIDLLEINTLVIDTTFVAEEVHAAVGVPQLMDETSMIPQEEKMKAPTAYYALPLPP